MSLEEEGAYVRLLCYCWLHGSVPADPAMLSRLVGKQCSSQALTTVIGMFKQRGDRLVHDRLETEREKQTAWREKSSLGGKRGGGDPRGIAIRRMRNSMRGMVRLGCPPQFKDAPFDDVLANLGYTMREIGDHLETHFLPGMTWENYGDFWQVDHVESRFSFELTDPSQFLRCWCIDNLRPLYRTQNASKGAQQVDSQTRKQKLTLQSSSSSSSSSTDHSEGTISEHIEHRIYEAYPRKESRATGIKAIKRIIDAQPLFAATLLERTQAYAAAVAKWPEQDRQYIPLAATWFNGERYNDDPANWERKSHANNRPSNTRSFSGQPTYDGVTEK